MKTNKKIILIFIIILSSTLMYAQGYLLDYILYNSPKYANKTCICQTAENDVAATFIRKYNHKGELIKITLENDQNEKSYTFYEYQKINGNDFIHEIAYNDTLKTTKIVYKKNGDIQKKIITQFNSRAFILPIKGKGEGEGYYGNLRIHSIAEIHYDSENKPYKEIIKGIEQPFLKTKEYEHSKKKIIIVTKDENDIIVGKTYFKLNYKNKIKHIFYEDFKTMTNKQFFIKYKINGLLKSILDKDGKFILKMKCHRNN